jgi:hypothetical protein
MPITLFLCYYLVANKFKRSRCGTTERTTEEIFCLPNHEPDKQKSIRGIYLELEEEVEGA